MKKALALALALLVATPAWADYRYNPYTGKLDYYEKSEEPDLSAYLTSATAATTYLKLDQTTPQTVHGTMNLGDTNTTASNYFRVYSKNNAGIFLYSDTANTAGEPGGAFVKYSQDGDTIWGETGVSQITNQTGSGQSVLNIAGNDAYVYSNGSPISFGVGGYVGMKLDASRRLVFYPSSTDTRTSSVYQSTDGILSFVKTPGNLSAGRNSMFRFSQIGAISSYNSFWNGFQLQGHTVTEGGANKYPMFTIFSSSTLADDPTDYSINMSLANVGALPTSVNYSTQQINNSKITFGFGSSTPTSDIFNLHYNSSSDILARVKQSNNGGGILIHRNSNTTGTYGGIHFAGTDELGFTNGYRKAGIFFERKASGGIGTLHFAMDGDANVNNADLSDSKFQITSDGNLHVPNDNQKLYFGAGDDASITYDGTNLIINPKVVGSGYLSVLGDMDAGANTIRTTGDVKGVHKAADGTAAVADGTYTVGIGTSTNGTITIKDGIITAITEAT